MPQRVHGARHLIAALAPLRRAVASQRLQRSWCLISGTSLGCQHDGQQVRGAIPSSWGLSRSRPMTPRCRRTSEFCGGSSATRAVSSARASPCTRSTQTVREPVCKSVNAIQTMSLDFMKKGRLNCLDPQTFRSRCGRCSRTWQDHLDVSCGCSIGIDCVIALTIHWDTDHSYWMSSSD